MKKTVVSIAAGTPAPALAGCVVTDENGTPIDGGGVTLATPSKSLTYNTAILAGGRLDLVWH